MATIEFANGVQATIDSTSCGRPGSFMVALQNTTDDAIAVTLLLYHVGISANHLVRSGHPATVAAHGTAVATIEIGEEAPTDGHLLCGIVHAPEGGVQFPIAAPEPQFYVWVGDTLESADVVERVGATLLTQRAYVEAPIRLDGYGGDQTYAVWLLLEGCLLDYPQPLEGAVMEPLGFGLRCESELAALQNLLSADPISVDETFDREWQSDHPLTLVRYFTVFAPEPQDAYMAVVPRIDLLRGVLAMERMGPSRVAIGIVFSSDGQGHIVAPRHHYEGNLMPGMGATESARQLESFVQAVAKDPWVGLIISMYAEALAERNHLFRLVRFWSLLEACAKREPSPGLEALRTNRGETKPGKFEYDFDGERVHGADFANVCYFVQENAQGKRWGRVDPRFSNCEILGMAYIVRNIGAHEGVVSEKAIQRPEKAAAVEFIFRSGGISVLRHLIGYVLHAIKTRALARP